MTHQSTWIFCIAAGALGIVLGYVLNWAIRHNPKPDATEITALIGMLVGGGAVNLLRGFIKCPSALAWYLIGALIGFFLYLVALRFKWEQIMALVAQGSLKGVPFFPWMAKGVAKPRPK